MWFSSHRHCIQRKIKALYVCSLNPFKEVEATVQDSIERSGHMTVMWMVHDLFIVFACIPNTYM